MPQQETFHETVAQLSLRCFFTSPNDFLITDFMPTNHSSITDFRPTHPLRWQVLGSPVTLQSRNPGSPIIVLCSQIWTTTIAPPDLSFITNLKPSPITDSPEISIQSFAISPGQVSHRSIFVLPERGTNVCKSAGGQQRLHWLAGSGAKGSGAACGAQGGLIGMQ